MQLIRAGDEVLEVRGLGSGDASLLERGFASLSDATRVARFGAAKPRLSRRELRFLVDVDHHRHEALVAVRPTNGAIVAVARYVTSAADEHSAEIAVTVGDAWQGRGVGSALAAMLVQRAREEGIEHLTAFVLADNVRSLRMLHRAGFRATARDAGTVELALSL